jgi:hypothetical protein
MHSQLAKRAKPGTLTVALPHTIGPTDAPRRVEFTVEDQQGRVAFQIALDPEDFDRFMRGEIALMKHGQQPCTFAVLPHAASLEEPTDAG